MSNQKDCLDRELQRGRVIALYRRCRQEKGLSPEEARNHILQDLGGNVPAELDDWIQEEEDRLREKFESMCV